MKVTLNLPENCSLYDEFNGKIGEVTYSGEFRALVRIELEGHDGRAPSIATLLVPWEHIQELG